jgi:hypothetical protein
MKSAVVALLALAACGKNVGKEVEKVNGSGPLAEKTEAVCFLAGKLDNNEAGNAISEHARKLLLQPQSDQAAMKAQIDCIAKEVAATSNTSLYGYIEHLPRAYAKNPSEPVTASLKNVGDDWMRKLVSQYLADLAARDEDIPDAAENLPRVIELMDRSKISPTWVSGGILLLWARTGNEALKKRIDAADGKDVTEAWSFAVGQLTHRPKDDQKKVIAKLFELSKARGLNVYAIDACKMAPDVEGCGDVMKKNDEQIAAAKANTSPIVEILQPAIGASAAASKKDTLSTFQDELDGKAPSPVHEEIADVPEMKTAHDKILALGEAVHKDCKTYMTIGGAGGLVCARALGTQKLEILVETTLEQLASYNEAYAKEGKKAHRYGKGVVVGLRALYEFKDKSVDDTYLKSLSAYDPDLAKFAMTKVKERAKMADVVDGLFQFMARKQQFAVFEIDNYVELLTSYGPDVTPAIVKNLEGMLAKAKRPEAVYWAAKVVALFALEKVGTKAATPILDRYAADTSGYANMSSNAETGAVVSSTDVPFAQEVAKTKRAVASR